MAQKKVDAARIMQEAGQNVERCRKSDARLHFVTSSGEPVRGADIEIVQKSQDFLFGNLIFDLVWREPPYRPELFKERFLELFNFAIFPFYWSHYERTPGLTMGHGYIPTLEWCLANGVTPKGHPLVWPYSAGVPEWLYDMPEDAVEPLIKARVTNIVKGFEKTIHIWDVTNEAVNHVSWAEATHPDFRKKYHDISLWRGIEVAGSFKREIPIPEAADWVEDAFRWAYAANPQATLILNDYNQEIELNVRQRFYDLVKELQKRGVPVSGLGLQVHPLDYWITPQEIWDTLNLYAELNVPIHITELHQPAWEHEIEGDFHPGKWDAQAQAEFMEQLYRQFFGHPSVVSINHWGFSERNIWMPGGGLVDAEYRPKPVFKTLKKLIKGEWMTAPAALKTDSEGGISFRGFYGEYDVIVRQPGRKFVTHRIHLAQDRENAWKFTME